MVIATVINDSYQRYWNIYITIIAFDGADEILQDDCNDLSYLNKVIIPCKHNHYHNRTFNKIVTIMMTKIIIRSLINVMITFIFVIIINMSI
jgi:hypothetical protein